MNSGQIFYIQKNDILPTQAREGQTFPRKSLTFPRLGWKNIPYLMGLKSFDINQEQKTVICQINLIFLFQRHHPQVVLHTANQKHLSQKMMTAL